MDPATSPLDAIQRVANDGFRVTYSPHATSEIDCRRSMNIDPYTQVRRGYHRNILA